MWTGEHFAMLSCFRTQPASAVVPWICLGFESQLLWPVVTEQATAAHVKPEQILERAGVKQAGVADYCSTIRSSCIHSVLLGAASCMCI